jgi:predicted aconitase with swiveling domain
MTQRALVGGSANGRILVLDEPLSLWGGVDPSSGSIVEAAHPQFGQSLAGRLVVMAHGRGSSSSSSVLAELLRSGRGPAGFVLRVPDSIIVIGALVARLLYGSECPVLVSDEPVTRDGVWEISDGSLRRRLESEDQDADNHDERRP